MENKTNRRSFVSTASITGAGLSPGLSNFTSISPKKTYKPTIPGRSQTHPDDPGWFAILQTKNKYSGQ